MVTDSINSSDAQAFKKFDQIENQNEEEIMIGGDEAKVQFKFEESIINKKRPLRAKSSPTRGKKPLKEFQFHEVTFKPERLNEMRTKLNQVESKLDTNLEEIK